MTLEYGSSLATVGDNAFGSTGLTTAIVESAKQSLFTGSAGWPVNVMFIDVTGTPTSQPSIPTGQPTSQLDVIRALDIFFYKYKVIKKKLILKQFKKGQEMYHGPARWFSKHFGILSY